MGLNTNQKRAGAVFVLYCEHAPYTGYTYAMEFLSRYAGSETLPKDLIQYFILINMVVSNRNYRL